MKIGDKVKVVRGNPFGKVGKITSMYPWVGHKDLTKGTNEPAKQGPVMHCICEVEDGSSFIAVEDHLELVE